MPGMSSLIDSDEPAVPVTPSFLTSDLLPKQQ
jgi:hypothetical protein